jgi:hypothetical protein
LSRILRGALWLLFPAFAGGVLYLRQDARTPDIELRRNSVFQSRLTAPRALDAVTQETGYTPWSPGRSLDGFRLASIDFDLPCGYVPETRCVYLVYEPLDPDRQATVGISQTSAGGVPVGVEAAIWLERDINSFRVLRIPSTRGDYFWVTDGGHGLLVTSNGADRPEVNALLDWVASTPQIDR